MEQRGKLIIFSAPSGSGKSTIIQSLLNRDLNLSFSISATSRAPRGTEKNGVEYYFITPDEFRERIANDEFLEYEEVYAGKFYGTLKSEVERILDSGKNVIFDVDVVGGLNIKKYYGNQALALFIQPPSIQALEQRLKNRATDTPEVIAHRIAKAEYELSFAPKFDKIIVNDILEKAQEEAYRSITAFFSGTFNPVHTGHLILANYLCEYEGFDEIWLSVSPQNPLREKLSSNNDRQRIEMLNMAVNGNSKIRTTDIEFTLPRPSYTIQTLEALRKKHPERIFTLIIGADNWLSFNRWKDYDKIIEEYPIYIYPRRGYDIDERSLPANVKLCHAPIIEISSTQIRQGISEGKNMNYFIPRPVYDYIINHGLYKNKD